jgi:hypothetical protein
MLAWVPCEPGQRGTTGERVRWTRAAIKANPAYQMTARELEVLRLLGRGYKIVEVADALDVFKTVANVTSLPKKLGCEEPFRFNPDRGRIGPWLTACACRRPRPSNLAGAISSRKETSCQTSNSSPRDA